MRIAYLSGSEIPSKSANSVHVMKMCQAFVKNGHEVSLYAFKGKEDVGDIYKFYGVEPVFEIIRISRLNINGLGNFLYAMMVYKKIKASTLPDCFYGRNPYCLLAVRKFNLPIVYESHNPPVYQVRRILEKILLKSRNLENLVVISDALKRIYLEIFPFLSESNTITAHDSANEPVSIPIRLESHGQLVVGYTGHLYPGRGMEIIANLADACPWAIFHIVGGNENDLNYWRKRCTQKNIIFHGYVPPSDVDKYRLACDVLLAPYERRVSVAGGGGDTSGWMSPLKIFEYMAAGKAILCSDLPVLKEILKHEYSAILCNPDDIESWINALNTVRENKELRLKLGQNAKTEFCNKYTWTNRAKKVINRVSFDKG